MRPFKPKNSSKQDSPPPSVTAEQPVKGAELLLSMVEARCAANNGKRGHMDSRGEQELEKIEAHIAKLEAVAQDQDDNSRREIEQLRTRIDALRSEVSAHNSAWAKTELARHPQRPYTLDYVERIF